MKKKIFLILFCLIVFIFALPFMKHIYIFVAYKAVFVPSPNTTNVANLLVLDLDGDGIEFYKSNDYNSYYDFDGDGQANLASPLDDDDGMLAIDLNSNGRIDDMTEVFRSDTTNSFKSLSRYDTPHYIFFKDGIIDKNDAVFSRLFVWCNFHRNSKIDHYELKKLTDLGITSISTKGKPVKNKEIAENKIRHEGGFKKIDGTEDKIFDAALTMSPYYSMNAASYIKDTRTDALPSLMGSGTLKHMFIAASLDNDDKDSSSLLMLNMRLTNNLSLEYLLLNWENVETDIEEILFRWAKADKVNPRSRGPHIDARRLKFYEAYTGEKFRQTGYFEKHFDIDYFGLKNPMPYAAKYTNAIYSSILTYNTVNFTMQKLGKEIFFKPSYDLYRDHFSRKSFIKPEGIERIKTIASDAEDSDEVWMHVVQIIAYTKGLNELNIAERILLNQAVKETSDTLKSWPDAIMHTEKKYGKIISSEKDWNTWDKSKEWRTVNTKP